MATTPIGRIDDADTTPGSQAASTALPTVTDSPYQPLNLPPVTPGRIQDAETALGPDQQPPPTTHAGAIAFLADKVLRGAVQGIAARQAHQQDQYNKKLAAQQSIYNDQAKQLHDMAAAGVDPNSDEFKQAKNRVLTSWQAVMGSIGEKMPQQGKGKKKQDDSPLAAVYQGAIATGPPVFHQIQPYLSPSYQAQKKQGAQTAATVAGTQATTADTQGQVADINNKLAHAVQSGAPQDEIDALIKKRDELNPSQKFPVGGVKRSGQVDGKWFEWQADEQGNEIPNTRRPLSVAGLGAKAPKLGWTKVDGKWGSQNYDPETNQPIPGTFDSTKVPPANVLSLYPSEHTLTGKFVDSNGVLQTYSTTTTSEKNLPPGIGESSAISHESKPAASTSPASTGSKTKPIGYVGSASYKAAVKQATDAQKDTNNVVTGLSSLITKDPKTGKSLWDRAKSADGPAQVALLATYLKTVVGGQGSGLRITKAEWDAARNTVPFWQQVQAKFEKGPDGIEYMVGTPISPQQADQMVQAIHDKARAVSGNLDTAKQRVKDQQNSDMQAGGLGANPAPKTTPETHVFDSKAWKAANPKGDVEAAKKQAKAQGYEVQ